MKTRKTSVTDAAEALVIAAHPLTTPAGFLADLVFVRAVTATSETASALPGRRPLHPTQ